MSNIFYIVAALVMLGVMITIHEAGHFFAARLCGIAVKQFAIGFGPKIVSWKSRKHETVFSLRIIPVGGFCMFYGEDDTTGAEKDDPRNLSRHSPWKRIITVSMGPVMNFILAFVVGILFFASVGVPKPYQTIVSAVDEGSPAAEAGMLENDVIALVDGHAITNNLSDYVSEFKAGDPPLTVTVLRGSETIDLLISPAYSENEGRMLLGILINEYASYQPGTAVEVVVESFGSCVNFGKVVLESLRDIVFKGEGLENLTGPVGVVSLIAEQTEVYKWQGYLSLMIMISVNLGLINLMPIPGLDGSRIVFLLIEAIRRKPINPKKEAYVHMAGFILLLGLMLVFTYRDILNLF